MDTATLYGQLQSALATVYKLQERCSADKKENHKVLASWARRLERLSEETYPGEPGEEKGP